MTENKDPMIKLLREAHNAWKSAMAKNAKKHPADIVEYADMEDMMADLHYAASHDKGDITHQSMPAICVEYDMDYNEWLRANKDLLNQVLCVTVIRKNLYAVEKKHKGCKARCNICKKKICPVVNLMLKEYERHCVK